MWSNIFSVGKVEDRYIISMATRHEEIPLGSLIKANCSILCDGHYFSVDEKGVFNRKRDGGNALDMIIMNRHILGKSKISQN